MYVQSIDNEQFNQILALLDSCDLDNATEDAINEIVKNLNKIYIDAVKMSMGVREYDHEKQKSNKRYDSMPWFTNACRRARAKYRNSKNYFF